MDDKVSSQQDFSDKVDEMMVIILTFIEKCDHIGRHLNEKADSTHVTKVKEQDVLNKANSKEEIGRLGGSLGWYT